MKYNLVWETEVPNLSESEKLHLAREIVYIEQMTDNVENLICHDVTLTGDFTGPMILAYGKEGNIEDLFLEYHESNEFIAIEDIDAAGDL